ncbi:helix-turn-helix domain-containing protein [Jiella mangrovi]|uniref:Helix-turn-helix transcriptional regulator n=1 Tax=Jiella mangrovi TaxID=2821407 RepID=A0ABS4BJM5_9HYPH|nr:helix-turn-helix transcriptional regulator [Jiella mangrovi]MBP0616963.1 helix-turn-helix transcriptional regulator [Jiella mangrovi]
MTPEAFKDWRKRLGLKQKEAADKLGLKKRVIQYYEKGHRDGKSVEIPKNVELACLALALGYEEYDPSAVAARTGTAVDDSERGPDAVAEAAAYSD